jgi:antitoxin component of RelBE/YafQ-DinJ toxin-antitoxin module
VKGHFQIRKEQEMKSNKPEPTKAQAEKLANAKKLAADILEQLGSVWCVKLRELKPKVKKLKGYFKILRGSDRIEGCRTWEQFCDEKLGRTASAVRKMLAVPKSEAGKLPVDSVVAEDTYDAPAENTHGASEEEKEDERKKHEKNKSRACKALREFLGSVPDEDMLTDLLREMFPDYLVTVNITSLPFAIQQDDCADQELTQ